MPALKRSLAPSALARRPPKKASTVATSSADPTSVEPPSTVETASSPSIYMLTTASHTSELAESSPQRSETVSSPRLTLHVSPPKPKATDGPDATDKASAGSTVEACERVPSGDAPGSSSNEKNLEVATRACRSGDTTALLATLPCIASHHDELLLTATAYNQPVSQFAFRLLYEAHAIFNSHVQAIVELLLQKGANPHMKVKAKHAACRLSRFRLEYSRLRVVSARALSSLKCTSRWIQHLLESRTRCT